MMWLSLRGKGCAGRLKKRVWIYYPHGDANLTACRRCSDFLSLSENIEGWIMRMIRCRPSE
ncbi:hypothetical protein [Neisseria animaloris]|uniref:hypothetical protein n=1 Tax=Neisseria animaloris TaxID=326522 RepID=UPI0039E03A48